MAITKVINVDVNTGDANAELEKLEGSYSSVMGLPLFETAKILQQAGITVL